MLLAMLMMTAPIYFPPFRAVMPVIAEYRNPSEPRDNRKARRLQAKRDRQA